MTEGREVENWHAESDVLLLWLIACIPLGLALVSGVVLFIAYLPT